jgi:phosphatidylserine decarboxylase
MFVLWFFRDPRRSIPNDEDVVVSPADGVVTTVDEAAATGSGTRISIRLSLLDVHVTRSPVAGRIESIEYKPGRFGNAYDEQSSARNEQNRVRIAGTSRSVVLVQIAGMLARRIVFRPEAGDWVERGQRVGMIRFGSRVDLHLPPGVTVLVEPGDRVYGGSSIVARGEI